MGQDDETTRKGPWTEQEDFRLVFYVQMFGDRRWDFIANVSGLKRTGKSCRLRWVNYLNPGLKRGKMVPHEERLVLELHSKFGNRWSKIARKLPGRTDNEIKNYWRTHMRKKAQEKKSKASRSPSPSPSLSYCSSSSSICTSLPSIDSMPMIETKERSFYDTGGVEMLGVIKERNISNNKNSKSGTTRFSDSSEVQEGCYSMDEVWKDIDLLEDVCIKPFFDPYSKIATSLTWESCLSTSWTMGDQEDFSNSIFPQPSHQFSSGLTG